MPDFRKMADFARRHKVGFVPLDERGEPFVAFSRASSDERNIGKWGKFADGFALYADDLLAVRVKKESARAFARLLGRAGFSVSAFAVAKGGFIHYLYKGETGDILNVAGINADIVSHDAIPWSDDLCGIPDDIPEFPKQILMGCAPDER